jgi:hypothetical protein
MQKTALTEVRHLNVNTNNAKPCSKSASVPTPEKHFSIPKINLQQTVTIRQVILKLPARNRQIRNSVMCLRFSDKVPVRGNLQLLVPTIFQAPASIPRLALSQPQNHVATFNQSATIYKTIKSLNFTHNITNK